MKALLIAAALGLASPAIAADMPLKAPLYTPVAAPTWQGFYFGVEGGQNLGKFNPVFGAGTVDETSVNLDDNSWFVGGHMFYLFQAGNFVIGPELGVQWWNFKSQADLVPAGVETPAVLLQSKIDWLAYAGARAGLTPFPSVLIYLDGGIAWAHLKGSTINLAEINLVSTQSLNGWYVGGGLAYKLTDNIILGLQYTHFDFGDVQPLGDIGTLAGVSDSRLRNDQVKGSLSFKLN